MSSLLNYKALGEKSNPCLVIVHGLFGSLDNWQSLAKKWSSTHYVLSIDVRNHGKSFHSEDMSFESLAKDILNTTHHLQVTSFHIMGHSMGGKIAMEVAVRYPNLLKSLIIVDVAPYSYQAHHKEVFDMIRALDLTTYNSRQEIETVVKIHIHDDSVVQFMLKNIRRNNDDSSFEWKFNANVLDRDYLSLIQYLPSKGYSGHTLFIGGEHSKYITKETSIHIFDLYPNAEFEFVSNAGHWVHADNPIEFYEKINVFLNKIPETNP